MRTVKVRDVMNMDVIAMLKDGFADEILKIEFDDGVLETTTRRTILSWFCWKLHREYPRTPMYIRHHIGNGFPDATTIPRTLSAIAKDLHFSYIGTNKNAVDDDDHYDREHVWSLIKDVGEDIYNVLSIELEEWMSSTNAFHLLEIFDHPEIKEVRENIQPNQLSINSAYDKVARILMKSEDLKHNPIVMGLRSKQIKMGQFQQIITCRGFLTDLDQMIFRKPITVGFFEGLTKLHDIMIESCSAKKALMFTKKPLQTVEYFNRKMQLSCTVVDKLLWTDCQSDTYAEIPVDRAFIPYLEGKYYMDDNDQLQVINIGDGDKLAGKTIRMRSSMFCRHRGDGAVCHVCFGELAWSVPRYTSIGHTCATELCREGSQRTMSVKHLDGSSVTEEIVIAAEHLPYIEVCSPDEEAIDDMEDQVETSTGTISSMIKFNPRIQRMDPILIIDASNERNIENTVNIGSITADTKINRLNVHRFTAFREVQLRLTNKEGKSVDVFLPVCQGARQGSFSRQMLEYIQKNGYTINKDGDYCISLSNWNFAAPVFSLPRRHASTLDFMNAVEVFIRSPAKKAERGGFNDRTLVKYFDPVEALIDFAELVNSELWVHVSHLEVILLSLMRPADDVNDYGLPHYDDPVRFEEHRILMQYRSMGQLFAYERQPDAIEDPDSYLITRRPTGLLDPFLYPGSIGSV